MQIITIDKAYEEHQAKYAKYDRTHAGPFDCGGSDSYYYRPQKPHYYTNGSKAKGVRVEECDMTAEQIEAYYAGYEENEIMCHHKDWS